MPAADHLIYTRVTKAYSPAATPFDGYQVVHRSADVSDDEAAEIGKRVAGLPDGMTAGVRLQFFRQSTGRPALCRTWNTKSDPKITDPKRKLAVLAHAVVLPAGAFAQWKLGPLEILDDASWPVADPASMVKAYGPRTEVVDAVRVCDEDGDDTIQSPDDLGWDADEWKKLRGLALAAKELVAGGRVVFLQGDGGAAANVLRTLFTTLQLGEARKPTS